MELSKLEFAVDTTALDTAITKLGAIQKAVSDVNTAQNTKASSDKAATKAAKELAAEQTKAAKALKDTATAATEAEDKMSPLEKLLEKLNNQYGDLVSGFTKGEASILQQARSFGAAESELRPYITVLEKIKELSKDPFDASLGSIRSVSAEFERLQQRAELARNGISLTTKQLTEYSRLAAESKGKVEQMGFDPKAGEGLARYNQLLASSREEYLKTAAAVNALTEEERQRNTALKLTEQANIAAARLNATMGNDAVALYRDNETQKAQAFAKRMQDEAVMGNDATALYWKNEEKKRVATERRLKAEGGMNDNAVALFYKNQAKLSKGGTGGLDQAQKDQARATKWLAIEEEKLISVTKTLSTTQDYSNAASEKAARSIANYERNLRQAGITGAEAATKLDKYRLQQQAIQSIEDKRKGQFLTRALQPQIGDVAVSLASGQNPLTVLLQQGDQVRGLIAQSGIEGKALQEIMKGAFAQTLTSIKDTAIAMGSVFGGAITSTVKGLVSPIGALGTAFKEAAKAAYEFGTAGDVSLSTSKNLQAAFGKFNQALLGLIPLVSGGLVIALGALAVATYQVSKQEDELSKSLALNGGSLGLNKDAAIEYATSLNAMGISTSKAIDVMTAMANAGGFTASEIGLVAPAAVQMSKVAGVAIADTVKEFAKLKEKPVEALIDLAKATGMIEPAVLRAVAALVQQGDQAGAAALAMKTGADVMKTQAERIKQEYSLLGSMLNDFGDAWTSLWDKIKGTVYKVPLKERLGSQIADLQAEINSAEAVATAKKKYLGLDTKSDYRNNLQAQKDALVAQIIGLDKANTLEAESTALKSKQAESIKDEMRLAEDMHKREIALLKETFTRQQSINSAIAEAAKLRKAAGGVLSAEEVGTISKVAGGEYDKSKSKDKNKAERELQKEDAAILKELNNLRAEAGGYASDYVQEQDRLIEAAVRYNMTLDEYVTLNELVESRQPYAKQAAKDATQAEKEKADALALVASLTDKADGNGKAYTATLAKLASYEGKFGLTPEQLKEATDALEAATPAAKAYTTVMADYGKTMSDIALQRKSVQDQYGTDFKTEEQKSALDSLSKFTKSTVDADAEYEKNVKNIQGGEETNYYMQSRARFAEAAAAKKQAAQELYDREKYLQSETMVMYQAGFNALKNLAKDFSTAVTDQFMNFAIDGKSSFEDLSHSFDKMVNNMVNDLIRLQIQKQVAGLLDMAVGAGGNWLKTLLPSSTVNAAPVGFNPAAMEGYVPQANGGAWSNGVQMYAKGDVFNSPTMFQHSGGLGVLGEAGAEAVMPLKRDSSGSLGVVATGASSGSSTSVVINNYSSEKATATESVDSRGQRSINVTIGDAVAGELSRTGSASQKAMQGTFGMKPQLIRR